MINIGPVDQGSSEFSDNDLVCYCFQYTKKQIEKDYLDHGRSMILEKITREKKTGGCDCARKHPKGL
ncbi:MAG TPA: BFD-like (2Fe-2S) protein [Syntrophus sp. (in: bacteria)]|nr:BFD-like (2Fe-2S) protein [Syntrophus sp. (in: bacteria)]